MKIKAPKLTNYQKAILNSTKRFTITALIADLLACKRVNQKLINKYDDNPTPSQPKNNCKKLIKYEYLQIYRVFFNYPFSFIYN